MTDPITTPAEMREAASLLPCPFCGSDAETVTGPVPRKWGVMCRACDAWRDDRCGTEAEAITAWNRRALPVAERQAIRDRALEEAAQCCDDEADRCDDAVKWGGHRRYIQNLKAAAYAMRDRAAAIRAMKGTKG